MSLCRCMHSCTMPQGSTVQPCLKGPHSSLAGMPMLQVLHSCDLRLELQGSRSLCCSSPCHGHQHRSLEKPQGLLAEAGAGDHAVRPGTALP